MVLRPRTRLQLRRAVVAAALGALFVPAAADAARPRRPVITKVTPKTADVGATLDDHGQELQARQGQEQRAVPARRRQGAVRQGRREHDQEARPSSCPKTLEKYMVDRGRPARSPTRFRLRVLAAKLSKAFTPAKLSPVIGPEKANGSGDASDGAGVPTAPDGDCDGDGVKNGVDPDDDNDLLADTLELALKLDPCVGDTDGDGVEDGFEYQSAIDLNNDDYQSPNTSLPVPGQDAVPEPALRGRRHRLRRRRPARCSDEYKLWKYTYEVNHTATRTLVAAVLLRRRAVLALARSRAATACRRADDDRPPPTQPPQDFRAWADTPRLRHARSCSNVTRPAPAVPVRPLRHGPQRRRRPRVPTGSQHSRRGAPTGTSTPTATSPTTSATRTPTASPTTTRSAAR